MAKRLDTLLTSFAARPSLQARSRGWGWGKTGDSHFPPSQTPTNKEVHRLCWKKCSGCYSNETFLVELFGCPVTECIFNFIPCTVHVFIQLLLLLSYSTNTCTIYFLGFVKKGFFKN